MKVSRRNLSVWSIYRSLTLMGAVTAVGLASALLGNEWWDYMAWVLLIIPVAAFGYFFFKRDRAT